MVGNFTLTKDELTSYSVTNSYATMRFMEAGDDYVSARCLLLNNFFPGFVLLSQSVEKMLKAMYFLTTGSKVPLKGPDLHNPFLIKQEISKFVNYDLDKYDELLKRLYGHYQWRYYENKGKSPGMGTDELRDFDLLWLHLFEKLPMPIEMKYRSKFTALLLDEELQDDYFTNFRLWLLTSNDAFTPHVVEMKKQYDEVRDHLYPNFIVQD